MVRVSSLRGVVRAVCSFVFSGSVPANEGCSLPVIRKESKSIVMPIFARIYFALFLFSFLCWGQGDVLTFIAGSMMGHPVPDLSGVWAALLTALFLWSAGPLSACCSRRGLSPFQPCVAWSWAVAAFLSMPHASCVYQCALLAAAVLLAMVVEWRNRRAKPSAMRDWWQGVSFSAVSLLLVSLFLACGTATTDVQHYEMITARRILDNHPKHALKVGRGELATSPRLLALRCYAMSERAGGLGARIFERPFPPLAHADMLLLPDDARQRLLLPVDSLTKRLGGVKRRQGECALDYLSRCATLAGDRPSPAADYYLCALLVDRRIDRFAKEVQRFYGRQIRCKKGLPHYYVEALVMYARTRLHPVIVYRDAAVEANLRDYFDMRDSIPDAVMRRNLLCRSYGDTFWWYFTYGYAR